MKKIITFLIFSLSVVSVNAENADSANDEASVATEDIVVVGPRARHSATRAELYTPQEAISDTLSEPLVYVGRGIPDPIRGDNGVIITEGASQYCVFKNSKVYVIHQGCRPTAQQAVSVLVMEVFRRTGNSVRFYAEPNANTYSLSSLGSSFSGTWNIGLMRSAAISGEPNLQSFFEYYNTQNQSTNLGSCTYGRSSSELLREEGFLCAGMPEPTAWRDAARSIYRSPADTRFNEFHDAIRFHRR